MSYIKTLCGCNKNWGTQEIGILAGERAGFPTVNGNSPLTAAFNFIGKKSDRLYFLLCQEKAENTYIKIYKIA